TINSGVALAAGRRVELLRRVAKKVGQVIRDRRLDRGLTQGQLAELLGVEPITVRRWELGIRLPAQRNLDAIEKVLEIPLGGLADAVVPDSKNQEE
ncbi:MAG: multiprotein-bridging factor 1 family protein, partial [Dehalococcoidia bacterium]